MTHHPILIMVGRDPAMARSWFFDAKNTNGNNT
jgi:hypothetical protein